tara:strand:- start:196 stop:1128 length:933 start_codon:yes stop_codon:yes gene_type:complete
MSFAALKTNRTDLSKLVQAASSGPGEQTKTDNRNDERFWQPTRDKAGNGYAVVRFLPGDAEAPTPWVRYWDHFFKGPTGQWYVEKSLTSIGQADPLSESNSKLWNEDGSEEAKRIVRERKRNLRYIANVLIVSDPSAPENEGQVKLYRFGKKIFDKIMDSMQPQFPDEAPVNPFDMWQGADFTIKIRKVEGYPNYDASSFKSPAQVAGDDDQLEAIYNKQHDCNEWTDPKNFKTYDELKSRLALVLGESAPRTVRETVSLDTSTPYVAPQASAPAATAPMAAPAPMATAENTALDEDDTMSYFAKLAADD